MYKLSNFIIVHNLANREMLINRFKIKTDKIKVIHHGNYNYFIRSDLQKEKSRDKINLTTDKKLILLFGNIRNGKGIETAISAVKMLKKRNDFVLLIAGKPSKQYDISKIKSEIASEELNNIIIFRDYFIDDALVEYYYKSSDIVLVPYENSYESGVLRYAFSCGLPVIASNLKEFSDFLSDENNCLLFNTCNPKHLSEKIEFLMEHPNIANTIAQNAKEFSDKNLDWETAAYKTKTIYEILS